MMAGYGTELLALYAARSTERNHVKTSARSLLCDCGSCQSGFLPSWIIAVFNNHLHSFTFCSILRGYERTGDSKMVESGDVERLFQELPVALRAVTVPRYELDHYLVALNACNPDTLNRFRADLRTYMEACLYSAANSAARLINKSYY